MFDSSQYGGADFIFKDSTVKMIGVADKKTYEAWLGQSYIQSLQVLDCPSSATGRYWASRHRYSIAARYSAAALALKMQDVVVGNRSFLVIYLSVECLSISTIILFLG